MQQLEPALEAFEEKILEAQKSADLLAKALKRLKGAAGTGQIAELERTLATLEERGRDAAEAARSLNSAWDFPIADYLAKGYAEELREEAAAQDIKLFERDGRLYAFPLLLKVDARDPGVLIGKKRERRIRPKHLAKLIASVQQRPQRFPEERFLALLYNVYGQLTGADGRKSEKSAGPEVSLAEIHALLTLLPGADYPIEEFGRDLLLLDRKPDLRTKDGASVDFPRSTLSKGGMKQIKVYDENGNERVYIAIRFLKGD